MLKSELARFFALNVKNCILIIINLRLDICSLEDGILARLDEQHESIYAVDWSPVDPWVFASVNFDGHFVVNQVPEEIKLGILLQRDDDDDGEDFDKIEATL